MSFKEPEDFSDTIDVVLPAYALANRSQLLLAIDSVCSQLLSAHNLWIVINGASCQEREALASFIKGHPFTSCSTNMHVLNLKQFGLSSALNSGAALSKADWLARLDADDQMDPLRLLTMIDYVKECRQNNLPEPDVIGSAVRVLAPADGRPTGQIIQRPSCDREIRHYLSRGNPFMHPSVMIRRSLLLQVGGYRSIPQAEDLDLWLRLSRIDGVHFANLQQPLTLYTLSRGSESHQRNSFLYSALCRLRHCDSFGRALLFSPKILFDFLRYFQRLILWR